MAKNKTLRDRASDLASTIAPHVENARDKAGPALADARDKAGPALAEARDRVAPYVSDARDRVAPYLSDARDKAAPYVSDARDRVAPYVSDARDRVAPYLSDARDKAAPYVSDARDRFTDDVVPAVTAALAAVDESTEPARAETLKRGKAVAAALRGEVEAPRETHRVRTLLIATGLGGVAFAVAKLLGRRQPTTSWQSTYTPPPVPAGGPVAASGAHRADAVPEDTAASDPAEAASDAAEAPHPASTPDSPSTEVDVKDTEQQ